VIEKALELLRKHFGVADSEQGRKWAAAYWAQSGPTYRAEVLRRIEAGEGVEMFDKRWKLKP
jgi:hypothetical protein